MATVSQQLVRSNGETISESGGKHHPTSVIDRLLVSSARVVKPQVLKTPRSTLVALYEPYMSLVGPQDPYAFLLHEASVKGIKKASRATTAHIRSLLQDTTIETVPSPLYVQGKTCLDPTDAPQAGLDHLASDRASGVHQVQFHGAEIGQYNTVDRHVEGHGISLPECQFHGEIAGKHLQNRDDKVDRPDRHAEWC